MLRFYARSGHTVSWPGMKFQGQRARYVGRTTKVEKDETGKIVGISHPATEEAASVDPDSKDRFEREKATRLLRLMSIEAEQPLWPADEATAKVCGVKFVPVELCEGEWLPKAAPKTTSSKEASQ